MAYKYTTLLFDADETLLDFMWSETQALKDMFKIAGIEYSAEYDDLYSKINTGYWKRLEKKEVTREEVKVNRFRDFFDAIGYKGLAPKEAADIYEYRLSTHGKLLEGAEDLLKAVYPDFNLYMITNGSKIVQDGRIDITGIRKYFKNIYISMEIGFEKPTPEYFGPVLEDITEKDRKRMLIIGDSLSSDIKGGVNTGIDTLWYNPKGCTNNTDIIPTYTAGNFDEVLKVIKKEA